MAASRNTPASEELRSDVENWLGDGHHDGRGTLHRLGELLYCIQTGQKGFDKIYGEPIFDWMAKHPEQAAIFDQAISVHGRETGAMLDAYDFSSIGTLADVGGERQRAARRASPLPADAGYALRPARRARAGEAHESATDSPIACKSTPRTSSSGAGGVMPT